MKRKIVVNVVKALAFALLLTACGQNQKTAPQGMEPANSDEEKVTQLVIDFVNQNGKDNIHITRLSKVHPKMKLYADFSETEEGLAILKRIRILRDSIKKDEDVFKTTGLIMKVTKLGDDYRAAEEEYEPTVVKGWRVRCNIDAIRDIVFHFDKDLSKIIGYESNNHTDTYFPDSITSKYSLREKIDKMYYQ